MSTKLYWVEGPWAGKLALAARPRGDDWLEDEIASWSREGVDTVFSLLTSEEENDLGLSNEARCVKAQGMQYVSLPIPDRDVPDSDTKVAKALEKVDADLSAGKNVVVHCRQGVGRSGLISAALLVMKGVTPDTAIKSLSAARGTSVPETAAQRRWIDHYAAILGGAKLAPSQSVR
jgi:protein-tyrosine phosphatase